MLDSISKIGRNVIALKHKNIIIIESSQKSPSSFQSCKPRCRVDFQQAPTSHSEVRLKTIGKRISEILANVCSQISYSTISVSPICTNRTWDTSHLRLQVNHLLICISSPEFTSDVRWRWSNDRRGFGTFFWGRIGIIFVIRFQYKKLSLFEVSTLDIINTFYSGGRSKVALWSQRRLVDVQNDKNE